MTPDSFFHPHSIPGRVLLAAFAFVLTAGLSPAADPVEIPLQNPGFEKPWPTDDSSDAGAKVRGVVAAGWGDNSSWADVQVAYGAETKHPHSGGAAQRIDVSKVGSGAVQFVQKVDLKKGRAYAFSVWMRGRTGSVVAMIMRRVDPATYYADAEAELSPEWKKYTIEGTVDEDTDAFLMIRATAPMEFWIDDAQLTDITGATTEGEPRQGNLIPGGSFEVGIPFGWSTRVPGPARWHFLDVRPTVDGTTAMDGSRSYRIDLPSGMEALIRSPLVHPNVQRSHAASLWMKASRPTHVSIGLERTDLATSLTVGTGWQRVVLKGRMPFQRWTRLLVRTRAPDDEPADEKSLTLWMDAVQLEEAPEPSDVYQPKSPFEMTVRLNRPGSVVFKDEQAEADLAFHPEPPQGAQVRLKAEDVFGTTYELPSVKLPAAAMALPPMEKRPLGVFKLTAVLEDAGGQALAEPVELVWSRLPKPREISPQSSFFGVHIQLAPDYIALARAIGARWVRLHDTSMITKWGVVQAEPGPISFFDAPVDAAHVAGLAIMGMLDGAPGWVSSAPREGGYWGIWHVPDLPAAPGHWEKYVRAMVSHYRGRIDVWEVWNEPWGRWWEGPGATPELYARLMEIAYTAAKEENPQAHIIGVDTYRGADDWHDAVLAAAKLDSFDGLSFHDYNDALYGGPENMAKVQAEAFNAAQAKYGTPKPLWNTEGGALAVGSFYAPETGGMPVRRQLAQAVRFDVTMMNAGVEAFCYYAVAADPAMGEIDGSGTEHDRAIKPLLAARAVLASLVDGAGRPERSEPAGGVDMYTYPGREGSRVSAVWSYDGNSHPVPVEAGSRVLDVLGNPILISGSTVSVDVEPVYLIVPTP